MTTTHTIMTPDFNTMTPAQQKRLSELMMRNIKNADIMHDPGFPVMPSVMPRVGITITDIDSLLDDLERQEKERAERRERELSERLETMFSREELFRFAYVPFVIAELVWDYAERLKSRGYGFAIDIRRPDQKGCALTVGGKGVNDVVAIVDRKGRLKPNQDKASCLTVGGHGAGNHSDMDVLIIQRPRGNNKGGTFAAKSPALLANASEYNNLLLKREVKQLNPCTESGGKQPYQQNRIYDSDGIMPSLCSAHAGHAPLVARDEIVRRITPTEAARLQTIPDWYKWECSATQQYKMLGNGWTVRVIMHIFQYLNPEQK